MPVSMKHLVIYAEDKWEAADFFGNLLGLPDPQECGPFLSISLNHGCSLYFARVRWSLSVLPQHYAFEVPDEQFDSVYARIQDRGLKHWGDRNRRNPQSFGSDESGRQVFLFDSNGHFVEVSAAAEPISM